MKGKLLIKFFKIYLINSNSFYNYNITRYYGLSGEPLPWGTRSRTMNYKYTESEMSKQKLKKKMLNEVSELLLIDINKITY